MFLVFISSARDNCNSLCFNIVYNLRVSFIKKIIVSILTWEARIVLARYDPKVIAITGSVGKTTTKDAIYAALSGKLHVRRSEKSFNSEIGVPLTILGLENAWKNPIGWALNILHGLWLVMKKTSYPAWLVLEVGADRPGDIRTIAQWIKPDIAVITGVAQVPVHVEYFSSPEALAREKRALAEHLRDSGVLVLNGDDTRMLELCAEFRERTATYGLARSNHFYASHSMITYAKKNPTGVRFRINFHDSQMPVSLNGALGKGRICAALAACAVAEIAGVEREDVVRALDKWVPPPGRMRIIPGVNGSTIIDDTYNSSPAAAFAALDTLKEIKRATLENRKIVLLGDMLELGRYATEAHKEIGVHAASCADALMTVGFRSRATGEAALDAGMPEVHIREYEQNESRRAGHELARELQKGDIVLVKGSQSMRMERAVEELMAEPERAWELLVRQEPEWLAKA